MGPQKSETLETTSKLAPSLEALLGVTQPEIVKPRRTFIGISETHSVPGKSDSAPQPEDQTPPTASPTE